MRSLPPLCLLFLLAGPAAADDAPLPRKLTLSPARPTDPALLRRLLPELIEQRPGNAAEHYAKAEKLYKAAGVGKDLLTADGWMETPLDKYPKAEARALLKEAEQILAEVEAATRCESCDFGHAERIRKDNIGARLEELQTLRNLCRLFEVRIRLDLAEGDIERALRTTRLVLAMARHAGGSPTLISTLVGLAIANRAAERLEEIVQQPGAPNLYWPLTGLPEHFLDVRQALQAERMGAYSLYLGKNAEAAFELDCGPLPPEEAREMGKRISAMDSDLTGHPDRWTLGFAVQRKHEAAKKALIASGRPKEKVEAMPPLQVAVLYGLLQYDEHLDEIAKWQSAPFWEAQPAMREAERKIRQAKAEAGDVRSAAPALPVAPLLLPAVQKVLASRVRMDRRIALFRCIEGVRLYAAEHDGKLPASLGEVKGVPLPVDPVTGKAFHYEVTGATATLSSTPFDNRTDWAGAPSYELTIRK
jgi:hypothetical protein